jgi:hypothetical protein
MYLGMISLLSSIEVLDFFIWRYIIPPHTKRVEDKLYNLYHFSSLAGWGLQYPRRKSGGRSITHGEQRQ